MGAVIGGRRFRLGLLVMLAALAGVLLAGVLLAALARPDLRLRWDWSRARGAGLSARTAAALRALPEGSRATAFLVEEQPELLVNGSAVYPRAFALLAALLEDARIRSRGRLEVEVVHAGDLLDFEQARERLGRQPGELLILQAGAQRQVLRFRDLFEVTAPTAEGGPAQLRRQRVDEALGEAAQRLARSRLPRVGVLVGYGPDAPAQGPQGVRQLEELLAAEGMTAVLLGSPAEDAGLDLLVVPGQVRPFPPSVEAAVTRWAESGKPLFVALGPGAETRAIEFWNQTLGDLGIAFRTGIVCEPVPGPFGPQVGDSRCAELEIPPARMNGQHPVTRRLVEAGRSTVVLFSGELEVGAGAPDRLREPLLRSGEDSWVEPDPRRADWNPGSREPGRDRVLAAAAVRLPAGDARAVLFGSAMIELAPRALPYIRDWLAAAFRWLLQEEDLYGGLTAVEAQPFRLTAADQARLANLAVLALPGSTLLLGLLVFLRRR